MDSLIVSVGVDTPCPWKIHRGEGLYTPSGAVPSHTTTSSRVTRGLPLCHGTQTVDSSFTSVPARVTEHGPQGHETRRCRPPSEQRVLMDRCIALGQRCFIFVFGLTLTGRNDLSTSYLNPPFTLRPVDHVGLSETRRKYLRNEGHLVFILIFGGWGLVGLREKSVPWDSKLDFLTNSDAVLLSQPLRSNLERS